jgi:hypothetical protein
MRSFAMGSLAVLCMVACSGAPPPPPPKLKPITPEERILSVAKSWQEFTRAEGYLSEEDIAFMRTNDRFQLHLQSGSHTALVDIERDELIRTPQGREFHCKLRGAVQSVVHYVWTLDEARLELRMPPASVPRSCQEQGFARPSKQIDALNAVYALRGDRLLSVEPATLHSILLPAD